MKVLKVLVGCEESQEVCKAFRKLGHEAYSCDLIPCSGGHPEWHLQMDVFDAIKLKNWDLGIFHPPCTYISFAGERWFNVQKYGQKAIERIRLREEAENFFINIWKSQINHICIENPRGSIMRKIKYSQIIQPYFWGDSCSKTTLLWLKNLPMLIHVKDNNLFNEKTHVFKGDMCKSGSEQLFGIKTLLLTKNERAKLRSKTFPGIAKAMAEQWSEYLINGFYESI